MKRNNRILAIAAVGAIGILGLSACASGGAEAGEGQPVEGPGNGDKTELTIGVFNGWPEGEAASYLWKIILEDKGYSVDLEYADAGPVFTAVSQNDYDVLLDSMLPVTHASYIEEFGDKLVDLGKWYDDATLTIAVNEDAPIDSLDELAENSDLFDNRLIGIEQGSGLNKITTEEVIPQYGLDGMDYITSSTPAMLAELKSAIAAGDNVAVTLWHPHWAYDEFPIKDLEDPKGALGAPEGLHSLGSPQFSDDFPAVAGWLGEFTMDSETLYSLENVMFNNDDEINDYTEIVTQWMAENQDWVDSLTD